MRDPGRGDQLHRIRRDHAIGHLLGV
jgi:hypothetical protein